MPFIEQNKQHHGALMGWTSEPRFIKLELFPNGSGVAYFAYHSLYLGRLGAALIAAAITLFFSKASKQLYELENC